MAAIRGEVGTAQLLAKIREIRGKSHAGAGQGVGGQRRRGSIRKHVARIGRDGDGVQVEWRGMACGSWRAIRTHRKLPRRRLTAPRSARRAACVGRSCAQ